jgi:hypothetical protein
MAWSGGETVNFAKMAADMDSHPKVRRAGRDGREVFLFVLRRNALGNHDGRLPLDYVDPEYLADQLMMDVETARNGLSLCVTAGLLRVTDTEVAISGWDFEWSKSSLTNSERQARFREKTKGSKVLGPVVTESNGDSVTSNATVTTVTEEEKRRERESARPRARRKASGTSPHETEIPDSWTPTPEHIAAAAAKGLDVQALAQNFRNHALAHARKCVRWNNAFSTWIGREKPALGSSPNGKRRVVTGGELDLEDHS